MHTKVIHISHTNGDEYYDWLFENNRMVKTYRMPAKNIAFEDLYGEISWNYGKQWFFETVLGNFEYTEVDDGVNTVEYLGNLTYDQWLKKQRIPFARDKGFHKLIDWMGEDYTLVIANYIWKDNNNGK